MMYQEDKIDEFDLKVKQLLEGAEEPVPPYVWGAVSSKLASGSTASHPAHRRYVWAAASLALAASLVFGILLPGSRNKDTHVPVQSVPTQVLLSQEVPSVSLEELSEPVISSARNVRRTVQLASITETVEEQDTQVPAEAVHPEQPEVSETAETPSVNPSTTVREPSEASGSLIAAADWNFEEDKDNVSGKLSIGVDGMLNVNDSRLTSGMDSRAHMTSGTASHTMTSIEEESVSSYDIPLTFGLNVRYQFAPRFSVGGGLNYSLIGRTFSGTYYEVRDGIVEKQLSGDIRHTMHYLGIPINFYFDFVQAKAINCYVYAGGSAEFCVSNKYSIQDVCFQDPVNSPQFSLGAGLGVQFRISKLIGLYIDPGVRYYFRCDQPKSIRTDQPFMVNFEAGLRFNL